MGRTLNVDIAARDHYNAQRSFLSLVQRYKGNKDVTFVAWDNSGTKKDLKKISVSELEGKLYHSIETLQIVGRKKVEHEATKREKSGKSISPKILRGFLGGGLGFASGESLPQKTGREVQKEFQSLRRGKGQSTRGWPPRLSSSARQLEPEQGFLFDLLSTEQQAEKKQLSLNLTPQENDKRRVPRRNPKKQRVIPTGWISPIENQKPLGNLSNKERISIELTNRNILTALGDLPATGQGLGAVPSGRAEALNPKLLTNLGVSEPDLINLIAADKTLRNVPQKKFTEAVEAGKADIDAAIADKNSYLYNNAIAPSSVEQVRQALEERGHNSSQITPEKMLEMMRGEQEKFASELWGYLRDNDAYTTPQKLLAFAAFTRETASRKANGKMEYIDLGGTSGKLPMPWSANLVAAVADRLKAAPHKGRLSDIVFEEGQ
ncbi:MAG: hypothetical protein ACK5LK_08125, partial [Chthoniobacterales bacterium]